MRQPANPNKRDRLVAADGTIEYVIDETAGSSRGIPAIQIRTPAFRRKSVSVPKSLNMEMRFAGLLPRA